MRYVLGFLCVLALGLGVMGCNNEPDNPLDPEIRGDGGSGGDGGTAGIGGMGGDGGPVGNNAPVIEYVEWEYGVDCTGVGDTTIQVTVSAKDADDPTGETLTYSGFVDYCGDISITSTPSPVTQTIDCELFGGLTGLSVSVKDPQGNEDTISTSFESQTCDSGCVPEAGCR